MSKPTDAYRPPKKKICNGCKKEKPLSGFNRNNDSPDGRLNKCKECLKEVEQRKKERMKEYSKTFFTWE